MTQILHLFWRQTHGATAIEYAMICAVVFLVIVGAVTTLGSAVSDTLYNKIASAL